MSLNFHFNTKVIAVVVMLNRRVSSVIFFDLSKLGLGAERSLRNVHDVGIPIHSIIFHLPNNGPWSFFVSSTVEYLFCSTKVETEYLENVQVDLI